MSDTISARPATSRSTALLVFLPLAFALSWYPWVLHLMGRPGNGGPNPLGVFLAALIAAAVAGGWRGSLAILRGLVRVRVSPLLWLAAFVIPLACLGTALGIGVFQKLAITPEPIPWSDLRDRFIFTFLFVALGEEPGWRGFLLPQLQQRMAPLAATAILSVIWSVWHLPLMGAEFAWPLVPAFLVSLVGGAVVLTWLYNASGGSILLPMIMHATINTVGAGYVFQFVAAQDLARFWWIYAFVWLAVAALIAVLSRFRLGLSAGAD